MAETSTKRAWFGWCMYDWANSAFATVILASVLPVYFVSLVPAEGAEISFFGVRHVMPAAALWGYAVSTSMLIVAFSAPYLGALADRRGWRRRMLIAFCLPGAFATGLLSLTGSGAYLLAAALFVVANIGFAGGNIFYNAFLPTLARGPDMDRLSARGYALGYIGGGVALLLVFALIQKHQVFGFADIGAATRAGFLLVGLWWASFALPAFFLVKEPLASARKTTAPGGLRGYLALFAELRRHPDLLLFLVAFLCYSDGIQTIIVVSAIFGREELGLDQGTILGCFLMIQFVAMPATLLFGRLAARYGAKRTVVTGLLLFIAITIYAFFMRQGWEFWLLAFFVALIFGGCQAVSRSIYGMLVPEGKNAEFFSFYAISDKFASVLGPFTFAAIADLTGSIRLSILSLSAFFILGIVLLLRVDLQRGRRAAAPGEAS